jgi:hypothetical protein
MYVFMREHDRWMSITNSRGIHIIYLNILIFLIFINRKIKARFSFYFLECLCIKFLNFFLRQLVFKSKVLKLMFYQFINLLLNIFNIGMVIIFYFTNMPKELFFLFWISYHIVIILFLIQLLLLFLSFQLRVFYH